MTTNLPVAPPGLHFRVGLDDLVEPGDPVDGHGRRPSRDRVDELVQHGGRQVAPVVADPADRGRSLSSCSSPGPNSSPAPLTTVSPRAGIPCQSWRIESVRVDQWLWSVRITRTRSDAAGACRAGHVKVNGRAAKPSTPVKVGDRVEALVNRRERVVEVATIIAKRVGAALAADCFVDHSPPPPERIEEPPNFRRDPGTGRPTKRDRRQLDRLRGRRP